MLTKTLLEKIVVEYYNFRKLVRPNRDQALQFLVSEIGELADANVHEQANWVRNHEKERNVADEVGDVMMMLTSYCLASGLPDPIVCMTRKFSKKGFSISDIANGGNPEIGY